MRAVPETLTPTSFASDQNGDRLTPDAAGIVWPTVGTAKRERQKANKARREQEAVREQTKKRTIRLSVLIGGAIVAVFVIVAVAGRFFLDSDDDPAVPVDSVPITEVVPDEPESDEG